MIYYKSHDLTIHNGDSLAVLKTLQDESVHCIVTSPPYWALRDYGVEGQYGLESTMDEHLYNLVAVFSECRRILRNDGVCWINYADSYMRQQGSGFGSNKRMDQSSKNIKIKSPLPNGNLIGMPWRLAFALQADGWILRDAPIWHKPNPMPESVNNRCIKSYENVFMLTKSTEYYSNVFTELRKTSDYSAPRGSKALARKNSGLRDSGRIDRKASALEAQGLRRMHNVWKIELEAGYRSGEGEHFATFPRALAEIPINFTCPVGGVVLDPFGGTGTTAAVALAQNKKSILIELSEKYCKIAKDRLQDPIEKLIENGGL